MNISQNLSKALFTTLAAIAYCLSLYAMDPIQENPKELSMDELGMIQKIVPTPFLHAYSMLATNLGPDIANHIFALILQPTEISESLNHLLFCFDMKNRSCPVDKIEELRRKHGPCLPAGILRLAFAKSEIPPEEIRSNNYLDHGPLLHAACKRRKFHAVLIIIRAAGQKHTWALLSKWDDMFQTPLDIVTSDDPMWRNDEIAKVLRMAKEKYKPKEACIIL